MSEAALLKKPTSELLFALSQTDNIHSYLNEFSDSFINASVTEKLNKLIIEKSISKAAAIKNAEINEIYGYQLFAGKRKPSRDTLLCLCVGLALNVDESQQLLKEAEYAPLYPKRKRDSVILFGIQKNSGVSEINDCLYSLNLPTL